MATIFLPVFPLQIVVFEEEILRLHIFEPRYKALIKLSVADHSYFGIPTLVENKLVGTGAMVQVETIEKEYPSGEMDIVCKALSRFEIVEFLPAKNLQIAAGAIVEKLSFTNNEDKELNLRITDLVNELMRINSLESKDVEFEKFHFYQWIHKMGMSLKKEMEMAALYTTFDRQIFVLEHLKTLVSSQEELIRMKKMIQLNGHFKKLNQSF